MKYWLQNGKSEGDTKKLADLVIPNLPLDQSYEELVELLKSKQVHISLVTARIKKNPE